MPSFSFVENLLAKLLQPTVIAAIASIGAHSLLAMALPNLSTSEKAKEAPTTDKVEVVELTPAEQQRLPNLAPIPSQAYQTQPLSSVPLLPPHGNFSSTIPDIRLPPVRTANVPPIPPRDRSSSPKTKPNKPTKTTKTAKTRKPVKTAKTTKIAKANKPSKNKQAPGTYQFFDRSTLKGRELTSLPDGALADIPAQSNPKPPQANNPKPRNSRSRANKRPQKPTANNRPKPNRGRTRIARNQNNPQSPTRKSPKKPISRSSRPAPAPATPKPQPSITPTPTTDDRITQQTLAERELQRSLLTPNEANTSDREAQRNYLNWIAKLGQGGKREEITITGTYPPDACLKQLDGTAIVGVLVDRNNNPLGEGQLIKSSGYPVFDLPALGDALTANFDNGSRRSKIYLVTVEYKYNSQACPPVGGEGGDKGAGEAGEAGEASNE